MNKKEKKEKEIEKKKERIIKRKKKSNVPNPSRGPHAARVGPHTARRTPSQFVDETTYNIQHVAVRTGARR
jgi:hypothetical protein